MGVMLGKVTCQKRCHAFAPSISAASWYTRGTFCRPARKITIRLPESHTAISASDGTTCEECEEKLKVLIVEMKAEIAEAKRLINLEAR